jgi:hypothetical protein
MGTLAHAIYSQEVAAKKVTAKEFLHDYESRAILRIAECLMDSL